MLKGFAEALLESEIWLIAMEPREGLLTVTGLVTVEPTGTDPKLRLVGEADRLPPPPLPPPRMPVPEAEIVTVEFVDVMKVNVALCGRSTRGAYTKFNATLCPAPRV
jgi:hypothetical protein